MKLLIKYMVCPRCKMTVRDTLIKAGLKVMSVELGEVVIEEELTKSQISKVESQLKAYGFELIKDRRIEAIEKIKNVIIELVYWSDDKPPVTIKYSDYIAQKLKRDYHYLSNLFSEVEGITIEKYLILQRIERAKELIVYGELNFQSIALLLNYGSINHFSNQFKSVTGLSPTAFKKLKEKRRVTIGAVGKWDKHSMNP